tara:strand:- start:411 stop:1790 length:1380 start_codon:yes stop_codon:yes gene_type:complete
MSILTNWLKITNQFNNSNDEKPSHLLLNGYKLYVKDNNIEIFNKKYAEALNNNEYHYIVECRKNLFKLFFDLDFLMSEDKYNTFLPNLKNFDNTDNIFLKFIKIINDVIYEFYNKYYDCIITTADIKKIKKIIKDNDNPDNIDSKYLIKLGFHLHFPDININKNYALEIRKRCIFKLSEFKNEFDNSINDIVDEHVFLNSGLRLTGSRKGHFISQTKEFVDEGRPYNLFFILKNNNIDENMLNILKEDKLSLINKTSIIVTEDNVDLTNIKNNPNLECEECEENNEDTNKFDNSSWKRLSKSDVKSIEILRFFKIYVKDYKEKDIKRIFHSDDESIYILCSQSKYCLNLGKNHNSEHIYFKLNYKGISQKCFCRCDTKENRKHGYCKDYESVPIPCTPQLRKILNFKEIKIDKNKITTNNKISDNVNINSLFDSFRNDLYNKFTAKEQLASKKKIKVKS